MPFESETKKMSKGGFKPVDMMSINDKDPNFAYRFIKTDRVDGMGRDPRGWETVRANNTSGETSDAAKVTGGGLDSTVRSGELALARMPKEQAEARNEYYKRKNDIRVEMINMQRDGNFEGSIEQRVRGKTVLKETITSSKGR